MKLKALERVSLRILLVAGFLCCALLTGVSGGAGIWSLVQIETTMNDTADGVIKSVNVQNSRIQQMIPIRKMIARIFEARTETELENISSGLSELKKGSDPANAQVRKIYARTEELVGYKGNQIAAFNELARLMEMNIRTLETITRLTNDSVNASESESIGSIEKETRAIRATVVS